MKIVKLKKSFIVEYKKHTSNDQLLESVAGRPCVLLVSIKYKEMPQKFIFAQKLHLCKFYADN